MRDGATLATDVFLPASTEPRPVVLVRLPYDKNGQYCFMDVIAEYAMSRGYSVVVQDVRGKFRSEGATEFGIHEVEDGYDTLEWIAAQPWCDGNIVMLGDSYFGMTQLCAVISGHPALKAISPRLTGTGLSTVVHYENGMPEAEQTARRGYFATNYVENHTYYWEQDWSARPLEKTFEDFFQALGRRSPEYDHELQHPDAHRGPTLDRLLAATPVPTLFTSGWYDNCAIWTWPDIEPMQKSERWAPHLWLHLEAIDQENIHFDDPVERDDEGHAGLAARVAKMFAPTIDFYDYHLGLTSQEPARAVFEVVHGQIESATSWPPAQATSLTLFGSVDEEGDVLDSGTRRCCRSWYHVGFGRQEFCAVDRREPLRHARAPASRSRRRCSA